MPPGDSTDPTVDKALESVMDTVYEMMIKFEDEMRLSFPHLAKPFRSDHRDHAKKKLQKALFLLAEAIETTKQARQGKPKQQDA